jgi:hypothetical protein
VYEEVCTTSSTETVRIAELPDAGFCIIDSCWIGNATGVSGFLVSLKTKATTITAKITPRKTFIVKTIYRSLIKIFDSSLNISGGKY